MTDADDLACIELVEQVTDFLEGALEPDARARFEQHLEQCDGCGEHLQQVRRTIALLHAVPHEDSLSPEARSRLLTAFRQWRQDHGPAS